MSDGNSLIGLDRVSNIKKKRGDGKVAAAAAFKEGGSDRLLTVVKTTPCTRTRDCLLSHSSSCLPPLIPLPPLPLPSFLLFPFIHVNIPPSPRPRLRVRRHLLQQRGRSLTRSPLSRLSSRRFLCRRSAVAQTATAAAEGATRTSPEALFLPLPLRCWFRRLKGVWKKEERNETEREADGGRKAARERRREERIFPLYSATFLPPLFFFLLRGDEQGGDDDRPLGYDCSCMLQRAWLRSGKAMQQQKEHQLANDWDKGGEP